MVVPFDYRDQSNRHYRRSLLQAGLAGDNLARVKYAAFRATMLMAEKLMADAMSGDDHAYIQERARQVLNRLKRLSAAWNLKYLERKSHD